MGVSNHFTALAGLNRFFSKKLSRNGLIQKEIKSTSDIFPQEQGHKYDFFYYGYIDDDTQEWVFHDWQKPGKDWQVSTVRYLVKPDRVYRATEGSSYQEIGGVELERFERAVMRYYNRVAETIYN